MSRNSDPSRPESGELPDRRLGVVRVAIAGLDILDNRAQPPQSTQPNRDTLSNSGVVDFYSNARNVKEVTGNLDNARHAVEVARANPNISDSSSIADQDTLQRANIAITYADNAVQAARSAVEYAYTSPVATELEVSTQPVVAVTPEQQITITPPAVVDGPTYPIPESRKDDWTPAA